MALTDEQKKANYLTFSDNLHYSPVAPVAGNYQDVGDGHRQYYSNGAWQTYSPGGDGMYYRTEANGRLDPTNPINGNDAAYTQYNNQGVFDGLSGELTHKDTRQFRLGRIDKNSPYAKYHVGNLSPVWQKQLENNGITVGTDGTIDLTGLDRKKLRLIRALSRSNQNVTPAPVISGNVSYYSAPGSALAANQSRLNTQTTATTDVAQTATPKYLPGEWMGNTFDYDAFNNMINSKSFDNSKVYSDFNTWKNFMKQTYGLGDASISSLFGNSTSVNDAMNYWANNSGVDKSSFENNTLKGGWGKLIDNYFRTWLMNKDNYTITNPQQGKFQIGYKSTGTSNNPVYTPGFLKRGGELLKFQTGGAMNEQQLQQAFMAYLADKYQTKDINNLIKQLQSTPGDTNETKLEDELQEFQTVLEQSTQSARNGARLYLKRLRGGCPDGYTTQYYRNGGGMVCSKCVKNIEKGSKMPKKKQFFKKK